jgi:LysM repeat protein
VQFSIGDDEDDDDEPTGYDNGEPMAIDGTVQGGSQADSRKFTDDETAQAENITNGESEGPAKAVEPPTELVEVKHTVARGDTLMSIARKYASDVSILPFSSPLIASWNVGQIIFVSGYCLSITTPSKRARRERASGVSRRTAKLTTHSRTTCSSSTNSPLLPSQPTPVSCRPDESSWSLGDTSTPVLHLLLSPAPLSWN